MQIYTKYVFCLKDKIHAIVMDVLGGESWGKRKKLRL